MTVVVIDVGCATWGGDESITRLQEEYPGCRLIGFDPGLPEDVDEGPSLYLNKAAAWTHDGHLRFQVNGIGGKAVREGGEMVPCFDLAQFIHQQSLFDDIVLKLDCEGAEYELVPHLVATDADTRLALCYVEWHCEECGFGMWGDEHPDRGSCDRQAWEERRDRYEGMLRCPVQRWGS